MAISHLLSSPCVLLTKWYDDPMSRKMRKTQNLVLVERKLRNSAGHQLRFKWQEYLALNEIWDIYVFLGWSKKFLLTPFKCCASFSRGDSQWRKVRIGAAFVSMFLYRHYLFCGVASLEMVLRSMLLLIWPWYLWTSRYHEVFSPTQVLASEDLIGTVRLRLLYSKWCKCCVSSRDFPFWPY